MAKMLSVSVELGKTKITWDGAVVDRVISLSISPSPAITLDAIAAGPAKEAQWRLATDMRANGFIVNFRGRTTLNLDS